MIKLHFFRTIMFFASLMLITNMGAQNTKRDWTSFTQKVDLSTKKKIKFKLTASVKADVANTDGKAGLWARVDKKEGGSSFFDNMMDRPITDASWKTYVIEGTINKKSKQIYFGGLIMGNGVFEFDDFKLYIENYKTGDLEEIGITNGSFENSVENKSISGWSMGITSEQDEKIEGYSVKIIDGGTQGKKTVQIAGEGVEKVVQNYIGPLEDYTPQIGTLVTMLNNLKERVEYTVGDLSQAELDYILDEKANSVGALLAHLTATELLYQIITFEGRPPTEKEMETLTDAMELGELGREHIKGKPVAYYLEQYTAAREETLRLFKEKDDEWLATIPEGSNVNNHFSWFHVMEHQSSHLGQILLLKKRIPNNLDMKINPEKKID